MAPRFTANPNPSVNLPDVSGQSGPVFAQGAVGAMGLQWAEVLLSSAQLLALLTVPVTLVQAPAAGFAIIPLFFKIILFGGTVAYTDAGGAISFVQGTAALALASNGIFLVTVSPNRAVQRIYPVLTTDTAGNPPTDDGAALTISKITNNLAAGNGTAKVLVLYYIDATT
jgi:hypothetical protein